AVPGLEDDAALPGVERGAEAAAAAERQGAAGPGDDLPEVPGQGTRPAVRERPGAGRGPAAVLEGGAHPGPAGGPSRAALALVSAEPRAGGSVGGGPVVAGVGGSGGFGRLRADGAGLAGEGAGAGGGGTPAGAGTRRRSPGSHRGGEGTPHG